MNQERDGPESGGVRWFPATMGPAQPSNRASWLLCVCVLQISTFFLGRITETSHLDDAAEVSQEDPPVHPDGPRGSAGGPGFTGTHSLLSKHVAWSQQTVTSVLLYFHKSTCWFLQGPEMLAGISSPAWNAAPHLLLGLFFLFKKENLYLKRACFVYATGRRPGELVKERLSVSS